MTWLVILEKYGCEAFLLKGTVAEWLPRYMDGYLRHLILLVFLLQVLRCQKGPGQNAPQAAQHNPQVDRTELKQTI